MMLSLFPAWSLPTVTTAASAGGTSRDTMPCNRTTVLAAMRTGSIADSGLDPCPPCPCSTTAAVSDAAMTGPEAYPMKPAGSGPTCCPSTIAGFGNRSNSPSATMSAAPCASSSAGWKAATTVPVHSSFVAASASTAPTRQVACMSCPHACMTGTSRPSPSTAVALLAYGSPVFSSTGRASKSARSMTTGPSPLRITPTTPVPPTPSVVSTPSAWSASATLAAVRVSWRESSGCS